MEGAGSHGKLGGLQGDSAVLQHYDRQGGEFLRLAETVVASVHERLCYTARMATKKTTKSHTSTRKKASAAPRRTKKAAAKRSKSTAKAKAAKNKEERALRRRQELLLKMAQMVYEDYQQGKFHRLF